MTKNPRINVTVDPGTYEHIANLAAKANTSMADVIRGWIEQALKGELGMEHIDLITQIIHQELKAILSPQVERLAALEVKTCIQAGAAAYLSAEAIAKFVPLEEREAVQEEYNLARKKAIEYVKRPMASV